MKLVLVAKFSGEENKKKRERERKRRKEGEEKRKKIYMKVSRSYLRRGKI